METLKVLAPQVLDSAKRRARPPRQTEPNTGSRIAKSLRDKYRGQIAEMLDSEMRPDSQTGWASWVTMKTSLGAKPAAS